MLAGNELLTVYCYSHILTRERTIIGSVSSQNRYCVYRIESYRLLLYGENPILRASLQIRQLLTGRITQHDQRTFTLRHPPRAPNDP